MRVKGSEIAQGSGQTPGPGQRKICKCLTLRAEKAGKCPTAAVARPRAAGID